MASHDEHHEHSVGPYVMVLVGLFVLTGVTVGAAYVDFGHPWSDVVAFAIAACKATLVVTYFMHVKGSSAMIKMAAVSGFFWMVIFFALVMPDFFTRTFDWTY